MYQSTGSVFHKNSYDKELSFLKCKTKIKKSFTKILTIILSVKIVLTLRVKLLCRKYKILNVREIFVLSFRKWKNRKKRWTIHWLIGLKLREQFTVSAFSLNVWQTSLHIYDKYFWNKYGLITGACVESKICSLDLK